MNETTKTAVFLALAVVLVAVAVFSRPAVREIKLEEMVGKALFAKFTDPLAVKKLEIDRFNAAKELENFQIAEVNGVWSVPSHENYPADAKDQMGKVAEALYDLKVLEVAAADNGGGDTTAMHQLYGVIDPAGENASLGEGIGTKITLTDANADKLVDLIIGKEVAEKKDGGFSMPETQNLRYVRVQGQLPVYVVSIDPNRFSTKFDEWIEKNLLDISTFDIKQIYVDEYSIKIEHQLTNQGIVGELQPTFTGDLTLDYNGSATGPEKWTLAKWMGFRGEKYEYYERKIKEGEELNTETLDGMISALNDLKIVSVTKKPAVLAEALRKGETFEKIKDDASLQKSGFYLVQMPDLKGKTARAKRQLLSNEGDIQLRMKDGIRYHLRFGNLTGTESEVKEEVSPASSDADGQKDEPAKMGANRYLFITADFDEAVIPKPDIKEVPKIPTEGKEEDIEEAKEAAQQAEQSNKREQERYDTAVTDGKKRTEKLSERFADWYYVIPEDVYKKIHLTEQNVFKAKQANPPVHGEPGHIHADGDEPPVAPAVPPKPQLPDLPGMSKDEPATAPPVDTEDKKEEPAQEEPAPKEPVKDEPKETST
ncbi:MAG: DUF4340 domain-containing protein [Planctomycetaceae bacterium]|jgi:hypothetical protein|nr:DUF4340 domain-containing protein [Planctomycetaceae bacterium]